MPSMLAIRDPIRDLDRIIDGIQGEQDEYGTMRQIYRIAELVPQARLLALEHCRHSPHLDRPDAVLAAITRFLTEHS